MIRADCPGVQRTPKPQRMYSNSGDSLQKARAVRECSRTEQEKRRTDQSASGVPARNAQCSSETANGALREIGESRAVVRRQANGNGAGVAAGRCRCRHWSLITGRGRYWLLAVAGERREAGGGRPEAGGNGKRQTAWELATGNWQLATATAWLLVVAVVVAVVVVVTGH